MGAARIRVSFDLLREALHLPLGTEIRFVSSHGYGGAYDCAENQT